MHMEITSLMLSKQFMANMLNWLLKWQTTVYRHNSNFIFFNFFWPQQHAAPTLNQGQMITKMENKQTSCIHIDKCKIQHYKNEDKPVQCSKTLWSVPLRQQNFVASKKCHYFGFSIQVHKSRPRWICRLFLHYLYWISGKICQILWNRFKRALNKTQNTTKVVIAKIVIIKILNKQTDKKFWMQILFRPAYNDWMLTSTAWMNEWMSEWVSECVWNGFALITQPQRSFLH